MVHGNFNTLHIASARPCHTFHEEVLNSRFLLPYAAPYAIAGVNHLCKSGGGGAGNTWPRRKRQNCSAHTAVLLGRLLSVRRHSHPSSLSTSEAATLQHVCQFVVSQLARSTLPRLLSTGGPMVCPYWAYRQGATQWGSRALRRVGQERGQAAY